MPFSNSLMQDIEGVRWKSLVQKRQNEQNEIKKYGSLLHEVSSYLRTCFSSVAISCRTDQFTTEYCRHLGCEDALSWSEMRY